MEEYMLMVGPVFGGLGGAILGGLTYLERRKEGEEFDAHKFFKSLIPAILVGFASGVFIPDYRLAFAGGLLGKKAWETYVKITK